MRVAIAGAGPIGRAIASALLDAEHKVLLIERRRAAYRPELVPAADWMLADACELDNLRAAGIETCDVVMAATGDDKANLVFSLLCKRTFAVPRVVARVNTVENQWLFDGDWGVDVAVSTPGSLVSAVEAAASLRDVVRLMTLQHGRGDIVLVSLTEDAPVIGRAAGQLVLPENAALLAVVRGGTVVGGRPGLLLQAGDELVLAAAPEVAEAARLLLLGQS